MMRSICSSELKEGAGGRDILLNQLHKFEPYSNGKVDCLLWIADLLCGLNASGALWCHQSKDPTHWLENPVDFELWDEVLSDSPMEAKIYQFVPTNSAACNVAPRCLARNHSKTTKGNEEDAHRFRSDVVARDRFGILTKTPQTKYYMTSHLIPKSRGDDGVREIVKRYGAEDWRTFDKHDARIGILAPAAS